MKLVLRAFYDSKYLTGRHFDDGLAGYFWAFRGIWTRNILRLAPPLPFPATHKMTVSNAINIKFHADDINNFQSPGTYFQNFSGNIRIGRGSYIAPNVGIITANHDLNDLERHFSSQDVEIGENCWLGMNAVVLPGVILGPQTIVGAGSVVSKSFPAGKCVIAGNPAKIIRML